MVAIKAGNGSQSLRLPRILCLHGGGTNANIFRAQCRVLKLHIATTFRLVFAEAPFLAPPGPGVASVYDSWAPFKSWVVPPDNDYDGQHTDEAKAIENSLRAAMEDDDQCGATGEWVGLLGFSQGARICASLLLSQQMQQETATPATNWRFAILLAGSGPLLVLNLQLPTAPARDDQSTATMTGAPESALASPVLELPTVHVHGLHDPGLPEHRNLLSQWCRPASTKLMEWDGDHRVPIKTKDVLALVTVIREVACETGVRINAGLSI
ncbi:citrinin biosynthesis oxidoreductase CtnB [Colletotrichum graminicola M1.001]|uniref:Citrinin biosynthesis oxydoreductase CtnB n=1 Tax=Colletotrichum graminicola (strain M1.001 / M2 / FGSC 10212) TaxID=645133 RepID=E3QTD4_COLGM|nr:citrinin biosynthesis oxidoreductase CtnB [Colletotrichum graminicola M1.001]EFQ34122.1 citrinin biosynthesis oxydoreductase CtnB [Colletotrichum graminicola M1.001]